MTSMTGDDDQNVNPTASAWEPWTYVPTEKAEQLQYYQNYDDRPQYKIYPFELFIGSHLVA